MVSAADDMSALSGVRSESRQQTVRRLVAAVRALIEAGADPRAPNRNGSTPMLLATLDTGKSWIRIGSREGAAARDFVHS
jgi:hypothetical protein